MKYGIPTCSEPKDHSKIYMRNLYHTFFWGPFDDEQAVISAQRALDKVKPHWDDNPFCTIYGADPLPEDFIFGFESVPDETKQRIEKSRRFPLTDKA